MTLDKLNKLEKLINSELGSKVQRSIIENNEILIEVKEIDLIENLTVLIRSH